MSAQDVIRLTFETNAESVKRDFADIAEAGKYITDVVKNTQQAMKDAEPIVGDYFETLSKSSDLAVSRVKTLDERLNSGTLSDYQADINRQGRANTIESMSSILQDVHELQQLEQSLQRVQQLQASIGKDMPQLRAMARQVADMYVSNGGGYLAKDQEIVEGIKVRSDFQRLRKTWSQDISDQDITNLLKAATISGLAQTQRGSFMNRLIKDSSRPKYNFDSFQEMMPRAFKEINNRLMKSPEAKAVTYSADDDRRLRSDEIKVITDLMLRNSQFAAAAEKAGLARRHNGNIYSLAGMTQGMLKQVGGNLFDEIVNSAKGMQMYNITDVNDPKAWERIDRKNNMRLLGSMDAARILSDRFSWFNAQKYNAADWQKIRSQAMRNADNKEQFNDIGRINFAPMTNQYEVARYTLDDIASKKNWNNGKRYEDYRDYHHFTVDQSAHLDRIMQSGHGGIRPHNSYLDDVIYVEIDPRLSDPTTDEKERQSILKRYENLFRKGTISGKGKNRDNEDYVLTRINPKSGIEFVRRSVRDKIEQEDPGYWTYGFDPNRDYTYKEFASALEYQNKNATPGESIHRLYGSEKPKNIILVDLENTTKDLTGVEHAKDDVGIGAGLNGASVISNRLLPRGAQARLPGVKTALTSVNMKGLLEPYGGKIMLTAFTGNQAEKGKLVELNADTDLMLNAADLKGADIKYEGRTYDEILSDVRKKIDKGEITIKQRYQDVNKRTSWLAPQLAQILEMNPEAVQMFSDAFMDEYWRASDYNGAKETVFAGDEQMLARLEKNPSLFGSKEVQSRIKQYQQALLHHVSQGGLVLPRGLSSYTGMAAPALVDAFNANMRSTGQFQQYSEEQQKKLQALELGDRVLFRPSLAKLLGIARYPATSQSIQGRVNAIDDKNLIDFFDKAGFDKNGLYVSTASPLMELLQGADFDGDVMPIIEMINDENSTPTQIFRAIVEKTMEVNERRFAKDPEELKKRNARLTRQLGKIGKYRLNNPKQMAEWLGAYALQSSSMGLPNATLRNAYQMDINDDVVLAMLDGEDQYKKNSVEGKKAEHRDTSKEQKSVLNYKPYSELFHIIDKSRNEDGSIDYEKLNQKDLFNVNLPSAHMSGSMRQQMLSRFFLKRKGVDINAGYPFEEIFDRRYGTREQNSGSAVGRMQNALRDVYMGFLNADYMAISGQTMAQLVVLKDEALEEEQRQVAEDLENGAKILKSNGKQLSVKDTNGIQAEARRRLSKLGLNVIENMPDYALTETAVQEIAGVNQLYGQMSQLGFKGLIGGPDLSEYIEANRRFGLNSASRRQLEKIELRDSNLASLAEMSPEKLAEKINGLNISPSQIKEIIHDPRAWAATRLAGMPSDFQGNYGTAIGKAGHNAVESFLMQRMNYSLSHGGALMPQEELEKAAQNALAVFEKDVDKELGALGPAEVKAAREGNGASAQKYQRVKNFLQRDLLKLYPESDFEVVAVENKTSGENPESKGDKLHFNLGKKIGSDEDVESTGYFDVALRNRKSGAYRLLDLKNQGNVKNSDIADWAMQVMMYGQAWPQFVKDHGLAEAGLESIDIFETESGRTFNFDSSPEKIAEHVQKMQQAMKLIQQLPEAKVTDESLNALSHSLRALFPEVDADGVSKIIQDRIENEKNIATQLSGTDGKAFGGALLLHDQFNQALGRIDNVQQFLRKADFDPNTPFNEWRNADAQINGAMNLLPQLKKEGHYAEASALEASANNARMAFDQMLPDKALKNLTDAEEKLSNINNEFNASKDSGSRIQYYESITRQVKSASDAHDVLIGKIQTLSNTIHSKESALKTITDPQARESTQNEINRLNGQLTEWKKTDKLGNKIRANLNKQQEKFIENFQADTWKELDQNAEALSNVQAGKPNSKVASVSDQMKDYVRQVKKQIADAREYSKLEYGEQGKDGSPRPRIIDPNSQRYKDYISSLQDKISVNSMKKFHSRIVSESLSDYRNQEAHVLSDVDALRLSDAEMSELNIQAAVLKKRNQIDELRSNIEKRFKGSKLTKEQAAQYQSLLSALDSFNESDYADQLRTETAQGKEIQAARDMSRVAHQFGLFEDNTQVSRAASKAAALVALKQEQDRLRKKDRGTLTAEEKRLLDYTEADFNAAYARRIDKPYEERLRQRQRQAELSGEQEIMQAQRAEMQVQQMNRNWQARTAIDPLSRTYFQRQNMYDQYRSQYSYNDMMVKRMEEQQLAAKNAIDNAATDEDRNLAQAQYDSATASLDHYRAALESTKEAMKEFGDTAGNFKTVGNMLAAGLETAATAADKLLQNFSRKMIRQAFTEAKNFVVQFDSQMRGIQAITMKTDEQMQAIKKATIDRAIELKTSVANVASVESDLYRQGLNDQQVEERSSAIIKFSTVTGAKVTEAGKAITTAIQNGLVSSAEEAMDALTALGDSAATTANEIFKGMQKSAAAAKVAGVSYEELTSMLTIGISKTQMSGQVIGTAMQTIFSRMNRVTNQGYVNDETGASVSINDVEKALSGAGIQLRKEGGKEFRNSFDVLRDLSKVWSSLSDIQRSNVTYTMAGGRQTNVFQTLMEGMAENNGAELDRLLGLAENSEGTTESKYAVAVRSITAAMEELKATYDGLVESMSSNQFFVGSVDMITGFVGGLKDLTSVASPVATAVTVIGAALAALATKLLIVGVASNTLKGATGIVSTIASIAAVAGVLGMAGAIGSSLKTDQDNNNPEIQAKKSTTAANNFENAQNDRLKHVNEEINNVKKLGEAYDNANGKMSDADTKTFQTSLGNLSSVIKGLTGDVQQNAASIDEWKNVVKSAEKAVSETSKETALTAGNQRLFAFVSEHPVETITSLQSDLQKTEQKGKSILNISDEMFADRFLGSENNVKRLRNARNSNLWGYIDSNVRKEDPYAFMRLQDAAFENQANYYKYIAKVFGINIDDPNLKDKYNDYVIKNQDFFNGLGENKTNALGADSFFDVFQYLDKDQQFELLKGFRTYLNTDTSILELNKESADKEYRDYAKQLFATYNTTYAHNGDEENRKRLEDKFVEDFVGYISKTGANNLNAQGIATFTYDWMKSLTPQTADQLKKPSDFTWHYDDGTIKFDFDNLEDAEKIYNEKLGQLNDLTDNKELQNVDQQIQELDKVIKNKRDFLSNYETQSELKEKITGSEQAHKTALSEAHGAYNTWLSHHNYLKSEYASEEEVPENLKQYNQELLNDYIEKSENSALAGDILAGQKRRLQERQEVDISVGVLGNRMTDLVQQRNKIILNAKKQNGAFDKNYITGANGQKAYTGLSEFINSQTSLTKKDYSDAYKAFSSYLGQVEDYDSLVNKVTDVAKQLPDFAGVYQNDEELQKMLKSFENKDGGYTISQLYDYIQKQARGATLRDFAMSSVSSANAYDQELAAYTAIQNGKATNEQYDIIAKQFGLNRVNFQANQDKYMSLEGARLNSLKASSEQAISNYLQDTLNATLASMSSKEIGQAINNGSDLFDIVSSKYASGLTQENRIEYENAINALRSIGYTTTIDSNKQFKTTYNGNGFIEDNPFAANGNKFYTPGQLRSVASNIVNFDLNADEAKKKYGEYLNEIKSAYPELYEWMNTTDAARKKELETEIKIKFKSEGMEDILKAGTVIKDLVDLAEQFSRGGIQKHEAQTTFNTELEAIRNQAIAGQFASQLISGDVAWANVPAEYRELIKAGSTTYAGKSDKDFYGNEVAAANEFVSYLNGDYSSALFNTMQASLLSGLIDTSTIYKYGFNPNIGKMNANWFNSFDYTQDNAAFDYGRAGTATTQQEAAALVKQATSALSNEKFNTVLTEDQMNVISRVYGQEIADAITTLNSSTLGNERNNASDILRTADLRLLESQGTVSQGTTENAIKLLTANRNNDNATRVALAAEYENRVNDIYDRIAAYNLINGYVGNDQELSAINESLFNLIGLDKTSFLARPQVNRRNYMANASMQLGGLYNTLINDVNNIMPFVDDASFVMLDNAITDKFGLLHRTAGSMQGGFRSNGYADVFSRIKYKNQNLTEQNAALQDEANQFALASQLFGFIGGFTTQQEFADYLNGLTPAQQKLWQDQSSGGILSTIATMQRYIGDKDNTEYKKAVAEYNSMVNNRGLDDLVALNAITSEQAGWIRGLNGIGDEPANAQFNIEQWMETIRQMSNLIDMDYTNADAQGIIEQARNFARFTPEVDENNFDDLALAVEGELERQAGYLPSFISRLQKASPELAANMMEQFGLNYDENGNLIDTDESGLLLRGLSFNWKDLYSSSGVYSNASNRNMIADILSNGFTLSQAEEKYGKQLGQSSELLRYLQLLDRRDNGEVVDQRELDQLKEKAEQSFSGNLFTGYKPQMTSLQRIDEINKLMSSDNFEKAFGELDESIQSQLQSFPGLFDYMATYGKDSEQAAKAAKTLADAIRNEVIGALEEEGKVLSGLSSQMNTIINGNIVDSIKGMNNLNQQITDLAEVQAAFQRLTSGQGLQRQEDWDIMQSMFGISAADIGKYQLDINKLKADYGGIMGEVENLRTETLGTAVDNILVDLVGDNAYKEDEPQTFIDRIGRLLGFIKPKRTQKTTEEIIKDMSDEEIAAANARLAASGLGQIKDRQLIYGGNANEQLTWSQQLNEALQRRALFGQGNQSADFKLMLSALTGAGNVESFLNIVNGYQQYGRFTTTAAKDFLGNADFLSAVEEAKSTGNIDAIMQMLLNGAYGITAPNATRMTTSGASEYITAALSGNKTKLEELKKNNPTMLDYLTNNVQGFSEVYSAVMSGQELEDYQIRALRGGAAYQRLYEQERNGKAAKGTADAVMNLLTGSSSDIRSQIGGYTQSMMNWQFGSQALSTIISGKGTGADWQMLGTLLNLSDDEIDYYKNNVDQLSDLEKDVKDKEDEATSAMESVIKSLEDIYGVSSFSDLQSAVAAGGDTLHQALLDAIMRALKITNAEVMVGEGGLEEIKANARSYGYDDLINSAKDLSGFDDDQLNQFRMNEIGRFAYVALSSGLGIDNFDERMGSLMEGEGWDQNKKLYEDFLSKNSELSDILAQRGLIGDNEFLRRIVEATPYGPFVRQNDYAQYMPGIQDYLGSGFMNGDYSNVDMEGLQEYLLQPQNESARDWFNGIAEGTGFLDSSQDNVEDFTASCRKMAQVLGQESVKAGNKFNDSTENVEDHIKGLTGSSKEVTAKMKEMTGAITAIAKNQYFRQKYKKGDRSNDVISAIQEMTGADKKSVKKGDSFVKDLLDQQEKNDEQVIEEYGDSVGQMVANTLTGSMEEKLSSIQLNADQIQAVVSGGHVNVDMSQLINSTTGEVQAQLQFLAQVLASQGIKSHFDVSSDADGAPQIKLVVDTLGGGRGGGGGGGGGGGKSAAQKLLDRLKREQALLNHEIKMIQYQETKYENASEIGNQNRMIELENEAQKRLIATLEKHIETTKKQMAKTKKNSDDWKSLYDSVLAYEEAIEEANIAIQENTKKIEENEQAILKLHTDLEAEVDTEINNRIQRERDMLAGTVSMQDAIIEAIRARYRAEWALIEKDIEKKRAALEEEKNLIDERLQRRKDAEDEAEKYEELSEYKKQLASIEMDSTRTKDAAKLREQIAKLEKEIGWDVAEDEADYQKEQIDNQLQAYDDFVTYGGEDLEAWLEDANNLADEVNQVMKMSQEGMLDWLKANVEEYGLAMDAAQKQMIQGWVDTYEQMIGYTHTYWEEIADILSGKDLFMNYMMASQDYINASEDEQKQMLYNWGEMYDNWIAAQKRDAVYSHDDDGLSGLGTNESKKKKTPSGTKPPSLLDNLDLSTVKWEDLKKVVVSGGSGGSGGVNYVARYASGGIVDYTGPAWVDGTTTKPEAFLDADDTALIRSFLDEAKIVRYRSSISNIDSNSFGSNAQNIGELVINITEAQFKDDADFDEVAHRVGEKFVKELSKQGFNTMSYSF